MPTTVTLSIAGPGTWSPYALSLRHFATYRYAQEFYRTAQKAGSPLVRGYLLGHAIELYLKAYLLKRGFKTSTLKSKRYGHNLVALLNEAKTQGLGTIIHVSTAAEADLTKLNELYPEDLRYFSLLNLFVPPKLPALARLFRLARSLNENLASHVAVEA